MNKKKPEVYRIRDNKTGLYYTGGIYRQIRNTDAEPDYNKRMDLRAKAEKSWSYQEKKDKDFYDGKHPWNLWHKERWNEIGKLFVNKRGAEKTLSALTRTSKHVRANKASNILFGNEKSNNYEIVPCKILDIKIKSEE